MILVIRGDPRYQPIFFEIMIYRGTGFSGRVLDDPVKLIIFCAGFSLGVLVGSVIEEKLALGYRGLQVIIDRDHCDLVTVLREAGYPVTCWEATGKSGPKTVLHMVVKRNMIKAVSNHIYEQDPNAFVVLMEPKHFRGGYIKKK